MKITKLTNSLKRIEVSVIEGVDCVTLSNHAPHAGNQESSSVVRGCGPELS